jgi:hypothetical protein
MLHLTLVDQATSEGAARIHGILEGCKLGSRQLLSISESAIFFSATYTHEMKATIHLGSGIEEEALVEK